MWKKIGYDFKYIESEYIETNLTQKNKLVKSIAKIFPFVWFLIRTFWVRIVFMRKSNGSGRGI